MRNNCWAKVSPQTEQEVGGVPQRIDAVANHAIESTTVALPTLFTLGTKMVRPRKTKSRCVCGVNRYLFLNQHSQLTEYELAD